jgi:hypothetical protein
MVLGLMQPELKAYNLPAVYEPTVQTMRDAQHLPPLEASMACYSNNFLVVRVSGC